MVRVDGIEPTTLAWKAGVLPLNYTRSALQSEIFPYMVKFFIKNNCFLW